MINTSQLYKNILSDPNHSFEISLAVGETGLLITEYNEKLLFGGTSILVGTGAGDSGYREEMLYSMTTKSSLFSSDYPTVGAVVSSEINIEMRSPSGDIPKRALLRPFVRATNGTSTSEWIPQGAYFVDTRQYSNSDSEIKKLTLHGYDAIVLLDELYPSDSQHSYPLVDTSIVEVLADSIGVSVDPRTYTIMNKGYSFTPFGYSGRETLANIASAYAGSFILTQENQLRLVQINELPKETRLLTDEAGNKMTFGTGGTVVRIVV